MADQLVIVCTCIPAPLPLRLTLTGLGPPARAEVPDPWRETYTLLCPQTSMGGGLTTTPTRLEAPSTRVRITAASALS